MAPEKLLLRAAAFCLPRQLMGVSIVQGITLRMKGPKKQSAHPQSAMERILPYR